MPLFLSSLNIDPFLLSSLCSSCENGECTLPKGPLREIDEMMTEFF